MRDRGGEVGEHGVNMELVQQLVVWEGRNVSDGATNRHIVHGIYVEVPMCIRRARVNDILALTTMCMIEIFSLFARKRKQFFFGSFPNQ